LRAIQAGAVRQIEGLAASDRRDQGKNRLETDAPDRLRHAGHGFAAGEINAVAIVQQLRRQRRIQRDQVAHLFQRGLFVVQRVQHLRQDLRRRRQDFDFAQ
jgi:hypothetical protein